MPRHKRHDSEESESEEEEEEEELEPMFYTDSEDEEIKTCVLCESDVMLDSLNDHIKRCLAIQIEHYGKDEAIKNLIEKGLIESSVVQDTTEIDYKSICKEIYERNKIELDGAESGESEEDRSSVDDNEGVDDSPGSRFGAKSEKIGEEDLKFFGGLLGGLYDVEYYGLDEDAIEASDNPGLEAVYLLGEKIDQKIDILLRTQDADLVTDIKQNKVSTNITVVGDPNDHQFISKN